jgi:hypothetical protein
MILKVYLWGSQEEKAKFLLTVEENSGPAALPRPGPAPGVRIFVGGLSPASSARSLRAQANGKVLITDGPYLETKEHMAAVACRAPLKKADLLTVVHHVIGQLPYNQVPTLAKRHKVEEGKGTKTPQEVLAKRVATYDEAALCRILLEVSLLDSAYQRSGTSDDSLTDAAKRYCVDTEKLQKAVAAEFAAKREKTKAKSKGKAVA